MLQPNNFFNNEGSNQKVIQLGTGQKSSGGFTGVDMPTYPHSAKNSNGPPALNSARGTAAKAQFVNTGAFASR